MPHSTGDSSTSFSAWIARQWRVRSPWQILLYPLSLLFGLLSGLRRLGYRLRLLPSVAMPVPVIVVGNLSVGGTGKTPLVLWLVDFLRAHGYTPGVVSRGYGGTALHPMPVSPGSDPAAVGDEPLLIAQRTKCPVWVGARRASTAQALLADRPDCDVLISDDGLQHYALGRDIELVVVDGERGFGNRRLLPAGPLREPLARLKGVDGVVINGGRVRPGEYAMRLSGSQFLRLIDGSTAEAADFREQHLHAVAGIGHPERFFDHLRRLGLDIVPHAFPDHHAYVPDDLQFEGADGILMTEKDAVKCAAFAPANCWALAVSAEVDAVLGQRLLEKLRKHHGCKTA